MFRRRYEAGDQVLPTPQPSQPVSGQGSFPAYVQRGEWQNVGSNIKTGIVNFGNSLLSALSNPAVLGASTGVASNLIPSVNPDGQPIPELVVTGRQPSLTEGQKAASDAAHQMSMIGTRAGLQSAVYPKSRKGAGSSLDYATAIADAGDGFFRVHFNLDTVASAGGTGGTVLDFWYPGVANVMFYRGHLISEIDDPTLTAHFEATAVNA